MHGLMIYLIPLFTRDMVARGPLLGAVALLVVIEISLVIRVR